MRWLPLLSVLLVACGAQLEPIFTTADWEPTTLTPEVEAIISEEASAVAVYLSTKGQVEVPCDWRYTPPQEMVALKDACCSGYARFWLAWADYRGYEAYLVAGWTVEAAHAFTIYRPPGRGFLLTSNNLHIPDMDLGTNRSAASRKGAAFLMKAPIHFVQAWDASGRPVLLERVDSP